MTNEMPDEEKTEDAAQDDARALRKKWLAALKSASKAEEPWRKEAKQMYGKYLAEKGDKGGLDSFNILYSNTDTLSPAIYNSAPKPDVRRRFADDDPLGKAVSDVLGRCLSFAMDSTAFDKTLKLTVLDYLLSGRAVLRVRYVPELVSVQPEAQEAMESPEQEMLEADGEAYEELAWEQVVIEHVQYDDFRRGPGRSWPEVCWVAFKHRLTKEEIKERFGDDKTETMEFEEVDTGDDDSNRDQQKGSVKSGTVEVWEIWDKDTRKVVFLAEAYGAGVLSELDDPLQLEGFFSCPDPLYAIPCPTSLTPVPLYKEYAKQADELDRISRRIIRIVDALKVRGIYDATIAELADFFAQDDNHLIPVQNYALLAEKGGFDKAIWMFDIKQIVDVLATLYQQREACKQVIYEIMGLSDILRGASNANETATAQGIKAQWGGQRVGRMQRDFQTFVRDTERMMAEIIGQKFQIQTLQGMTGLQFADDQQVQQMAAQYQQQAAQLQAQGQQPPPPPAPPITWEQIKGVLADDMKRAFKIDIETDSTISASLQTDMTALQSLLAGISQVITSFTPLVQAQAMPVEAVKELVMAVIRRAKLGNAVEDAFDKITQPPAPQQPQQPADNSLQIAQMKQQADQAKAQADMQLQQAQMQVDLQIAREQIQADLQKEQMRIQAQKEIEIMRLQSQSAIHQSTIDNQPETV